MTLVLDLASFFRTDCFILTTEIGSWKICILNVLLNFLFLAKKIESHLMLKITIFLRKTFKIWQKIFQYLRVASQHQKCQPARAIRPKKQLYQYCKIIISTELLTRAGKILKMNKLIIFKDKKLKITALNTLLQNIHKAKTSSMSSEILKNKMVIVTLIYSIKSSFSLKLKL